MGERDLALQKHEMRGAEPMQVDTFGGRLDVEWDTDSKATPIGRTVRHGGQSQLCLTPMHAAGRVIAARIGTIRAGLGYVKHVAERLPSKDRWDLLVRYIVDRILVSTRAVRRNQPAVPAPATG